MRATDPFSLPEAPKHRYTVLPNESGFFDSEKLCAFSSLREKTLNQDEWIGSEAAVVKGAGVYRLPRAKAQRKMG